MHALVVRAPAEYLVSEVLKGTKQVLIAVLGKFN